MNWYLAALKKYATIEGRARRTEYWMFLLFNIIFVFAATILDIFIFGTSIEDTGIITMLYILAIFIPNISVSVRRLHDINKSGWWFLIHLVPLIGNLWFLILTCLDSTPGPNEYGENPKEITN